MIESKQLKEIPLFQQFAPDPLNTIAEQALERSLDKDTPIVRQHTEANFAYFLMEGRAQVFLEFPGTDRVVVDTIENPGALIGWSAFRPPYRNTSTVSCLESCRVIKIPASVLHSEMKKDPKFGFELLQRVTEVVSNRLEHTRNLLVSPHYDYGKS